MLSQWRIQKFWKGLSDQKKVARKREIFATTPTFATSNVTPSILVTHVTVYMCLVSNFHKELWLANITVHLARLARIYISL